MKFKYLLVGAAVAGFAGSAVNASTVTYTNGDTIAFTNGAASIHGSQMSAPATGTDVFKFSTTGSSMFSGTVTTHGLLSGATPPVVTAHLDFTSATLTGDNGFSFTYGLPAVGADETISLDTLALAAGNYTLSIGYNVTAASMNTAATYDGGLHLTAGVPEPASWAMFIGGFGMIGGAARRKKATVTFA